MVCQAVLDAAGSADLVEAVGTITGSPAIAVARQIRNLDAVIPEHSVNQPVRYAVPRDAKRLPLLRRQAQLHTASVRYR
jgi:hypothetical protein